MLSLNLFDRIRYLIIYIITILIITFIPFFTDAQRVAQIGNELTSGGSGEPILGATFLLNDHVTQDGILFAFSAYVEELTKMRFQIWRPSNGTNELEYDLVAEKEARPTVQQQREDVS